MFFPPRYIIRVIKSVVFIALLFCIVISVMFFFSEHSTPGLTMLDMVPKWRQMLAFFAIYGLVYPLVAFIRKEVWLIKPFAEERADIIRIFDTVGYELNSDAGGIMKFRLKNKLSRLTRLLCEDTIEVDYTTVSPLVVNGLRKDTYRIARYIELLNRKDEDLN